MQVTNPRYWQNKSGWGGLSIEIDGVEIDIIEPKATMFLEGIVYLGAAFESKLPAIEHDGLKLRGFTKDPEIVYWQTRFVLDMQHERFAPGPLEKTDLDPEELKAARDGVFED